MNYPYPTCQKSIKLATPTPFNDITGKQQQRTLAAASLPCELKSSSVFTRFLSTVLITSLLLLNTNLLVVYDTRLNHLEILNVTANFQVALITVLFLDNETALLILMDLWSATAGS